MMQITNQSRSWNGTYEATFPTNLPLHNDTWIWGYAQAVDNASNVGISDSGTAQRIFRSMTPNPNDSWMSVSMAVNHIDPRTMALNLWIDVRMENFFTYEETSLTGDSFNINVDEGFSFNRFYFANSVDNYWLYYKSGSPELYPFDSYYYNITFNVPNFINDVKLDPWFIIYSGFQNASDNSLWNVTLTEKVIHPPATSSPAGARLTIGIWLKRLPEQVNYLLIVPTLSLYVLLGASVFLRGPSEIRNRLLLYLNVFVFSFTFLTFMHGLRMTPDVVEFSMMDRIVLWLVPATVILFTVTVLSALVRDGREAGFLRMTVADAAGILISAIILYWYSGVHPYIPWNSSVTIYLISIPFYGLLYFAAFALPVIGNLVYLRKELWKEMAPIVRTAKQSVRWRIARLRAFARLWRL